MPCICNGKPSPTNLEHMEASELAVYYDREAEPKNSDLKKLAKPRSGKISRKIQDTIRKILQEDSFTALH